MKLQNEAEVRADLAGVVTGDALEALVPHKVCNIISSVWLVLKLSYSGEKHKVRS